MRTNFDVPADQYVKTPWLDTHHLVPEIECSVIFKQVDETPEKVCLAYFSDTPAAARNAVLRYAETALKKEETLYRLNSPASGLVAPDSFKQIVVVLQKYVAVPSFSTKPPPLVENLVFGGDCSRVTVCEVPPDVDVHVAWNVAFLPLLAALVIARSCAADEELFLAVVVVVLVDELDPQADNATPPTSTAATATELHFTKIPRCFISTPLHPRHDAASTSRR